MALRARLTPPRETQTSWPWHTFKSSSIRASILFTGDRRMEADSFLASGYGTRIAIEAKADGWLRFSELATVWQPPRLKGITVAPEYGAPYLSATQVFDARPRSRRFLSMEQIDDPSALEVVQGQILITRSGTVGRSTLAQSFHENHIISDDLLRVEPRSNAQWGWIYAYLRAPSIISLMQAAHYGHVIKHLETSHLNDLPIVEVDGATQKYFSDKVRRILDTRSQGERLLMESERIICEVFRLDDRDEGEDSHSRVRASDFFSGRRRMEAAFHSSQVRNLLATLHGSAERIDTLKNVVERVWWMTRFSRSFGSDGVPYMSADELFSNGQISRKRVYIDPIPNYRDFFVRKGWLLMACSGQIYGLNGSVTMATAYDESFFFSHDLIRIAPKPAEIRSGYLFAYLGHPEIGQKLIRRTAYGSSVPHIDPGDVEELPIARLNGEMEDQIADLAENATHLRAEAAGLEREVGEEAEQIVQSFIR